MPFPSSLFSNYLLPLLLSFVVLESSLGLERDLETIFSLTGSHLRIKSNFTQSWIVLGLAIVGLVILEGDPETQFFPATVTLIHLFILHRCKIILHIKKTIKWIHLLLIMTGLHSVLCLTEVKTVCFFFCFFFKAWEIYIAKKVRLCEFESFSLSYRNLAFEY